MLTKQTISKKVSLEILNIHPYYYQQPLGMPPTTCWRCEKVFSYLDHVHLCVCKNSANIIICTECLGEIENAEA